MSSKEKKPHVFIEESLYIGQNEVDRVGLAGK
jgi:hypothetical protein